MSQDYYECLEVPKNASQSEIKKAYYECSRKYHPDKNPGNKEYEEKYKSCVEAYEILKDEEKRRLYDQFGKDGLNQRGMNFNPADFFSGFPFMQKQQQPQNQFTIQLKISLLELYQGVSKTITFDRQILCKTCQGKGTNNNVDPTCKQCQGQGKQVRIVRQGPMQFQTIEVCQKCQGAGSVIKPEDQCSSCSGHKLSKERKQLKVDIPPGASWGQHITFFGESHELPNKATGDVIVVLIQNDQPEPFERQGQHLFIKQTINLLQAMNGQHINIKHMNGQTIVVDGGVIQPNSIKKLIGYGMPILNQDSFGDLYITFEVKIDFTPQQMKQILKLFPNNDRHDVKKLTLYDVDELPQENHDQFPNMDPNVQCAQQ